MYIDGPSGKIECQLDQVADGGKEAIAVLCHPHPLYGGSMHDRVLSTVAHCFIESGITCPVSYTHLTLPTNREV